MSEQEKEVGKRLANALKLLPKDKTEYFLGFAEGVETAMQAQKEENSHED